MSRLVWYISGTRADFGLMRSTLDAISRHSDLRLGILVTGMHLDEQFGETYREIDKAGFEIVLKQPLAKMGTGGAAMAKGIAQMIDSFTDAMQRERPDLVLLLGDRGEMLAGAIAAIHLDIPVVHIHGGERSGTVDEPVRHAISKLAHIHFAATKEAAGRLKRMGERADKIHIVGAPGLVGLDKAASQPRSAIAEKAGLDPDRLIALLVYHPVLQEAGQGGQTTKTILEALASRGFQTVALMPNSDGGSEPIRAELNSRSADPNLVVATHFPREHFVSWMATADLMIGNSSSGIIEAASFGTPVVNIGSRQHLRERNANVIDAASDDAAIQEAIDAALTLGRFPPCNVYGDGHADRRIAGLLSELTLDGVTRKSNAF